MDPSVDPRKKDGALHCIGALAELLLKVCVCARTSDFTDWMEVFECLSITFATEADVQGADGADAAKLRLPFAQLSSKLPSSQGE